MHRKILGTWKSDKTTTIKRWRWPRGVKPARREKFSALFGKLVIRYTRNHIYTDLDGFRQKSRYRVIAADKISLVLEKTDTAESLRTLPPSLQAFFAGIRLSHIFFEGEKYWVRVAGGWQQEWFSRVTPKQKKAPPPTRGSRSTPKPGHA